MTYPPQEPGREPGQPPADPPPADPFLSPPSFDQPYGHGPGPSDPFSTPPSDPFTSPPAGADPYSSPPAGADPYSAPPAGTDPYSQPPTGDPYAPPPPTSPYGATMPYGPYGPASGPASPAAPGSGPPGPPYGPYGPAGGFPPPQPPRRNRRGLVILGSVLAGVLVLCLGGVTVGFLLLRDTDRDGAESPTAAVQSFLQAVYQDLDPVSASALVCSEARDEEALEAKISELSEYQSTQVEPRFTWSSPQVVGESGDLATVATTLTMTTGDEKVSEQALEISVLDKGSNGWWVCDVATVTTETPPPPTPEGE